MTVIPAVFSDVHKCKESCLKQTPLCMRQISMEKLLDLKRYWVLEPPKTRTGGQGSLLLDTDVSVWHFILCSELAYDPCKETRQ